ncbi:universal stress protein [Microbacterium gallinarum]|jgi:nucleotide-binding universal stress UspA family protein|uniref:Universal stress protein n=1 Tax=Microbacterium gallinarum TaxID=2762209 RepID=A0ABR8WZI1_9MICO|nr:universal stress protein [Microbacterium gallinarum]MBD8022404.1 universal stress protein [Microbacterium gallinarum]
MERIVLGFDGSPAAASALSWVATRAARGATTVDLVEVVSGFGGVRADAADPFDDAEELLRDRAPAAVVRRHPAVAGDPGHGGDATVDAGLYVAGIDPGHPIRSAVAATSSLRVRTIAQVPVVLVPAGWIDVGDPVTVGIADDDSSAAALAFAALEAAATAASLRLVHAWLMPTPSFEGTAALVATPADVMAEHGAILDTAATWVAAQHPTVRVERELVRDSRAAALLRFAPRSSMVVIGGRRSGRVAPGLRDSVAAGVLWDAECPVVVVPHDAALAQPKEV